MFSIIIISHVFKRRYLSTPVLTGSGEYCFHNEPLLKILPATSNKNIFSRINAPKKAGGEYFYGEPIKKYFNFFWQKCKKVLTNIFV
jgi:hypothetical protein